MSKTTKSLGGGDSRKETCAKPRAGAVALHSDHQGRASRKAVEPLLMLQNLPARLPLSQSPDSYSGELERGTRVDLLLNDPAIHVRLRDDAGFVVSQLTMQAFGHQYSAAYWFPFGPAFERECGGASLDLTEVHSRIHQLLARVRLFDTDEDAATSSALAVAAADYLRARSGTSENWLLSLSGPFELRLESDEVGDGDGLLMAFEELPPGLSELGECAVIQFEDGARPYWLLRPVVCDFDNRCSADPESIASARAKLVALGMDESEIACLDATAEQIRSEYARQMEH